MRYAVIDTETTGMDPDKDRAIEIAAVWNDGTYGHSLINPGDRKISFGAMATHHITPNMVDDAPDRLAAPHDIGLRPDDAPDVLVFHHAAFDRGFLPEWTREIPWVCTYRCALHLCPDAESHKNGALWYELGLDHEMPAEAGNMPHRALFDALMTADLLRWMLDHAPVEDVIEGGDVEAMRVLWRLSREPALLKTCTFGKNKGLAWADIPSDFMRWVLKQDFDEDVRHTCRHWLDQRGHG